MLYSLIDWYTAMWYHASIADVFNYYGSSFGDIFGFADCWSKVYENNKVGFDSFVLHNDFGLDIRIERRAVVDAFPDAYPDKYNLIPADVVLHKVFSRIRVDLSGSGLGFLRDQGIDVDTILRKPFIPGVGSSVSMHCTRLDIAFDWIDENSHCLFDLKDWLDDPLRQIDMVCSDRVLCGDGNSMKYSVHWGSSRTIYIGSTGSDRLLRMYDKKFEFESKLKWSTDSVVYRSFSDPDALPESWIRFEMQLRNEKAHFLLFSDCDYMDMLRYLYDHFKFRKERMGGVIDIWRTLFDWNSIEVKPVLNSHFVQSPEKSDMDRISFMLKFMCGLCASYNCGFLDTVCADMLNTLRSSPRDHDRKRFKFIWNYMHMRGGAWHDPDRLRCHADGTLYFSD